MNRNLPILSLSILVKTRQVGFLLFHGYEEEGNEDLGSSDGILFKASNVPFSITSKEDWFNFFNTHEGTIVSENDTEFSNKEFKTLVEMSSPTSLWMDKKLNNHFDYYKINAKLDNEGYPICYCNFC